MDKTVEIILIIAGILVVTGLAFVIVIRPWYMRWGATDVELAMPLPGDELKPAYDVIRTRAITIQAPPEKIYPWLVQMGQGKAGLYSIEFLENLVGMEFTNADSIHPEWQQIQIGEPVRMGPDGKAPPPYIVAAIYPNQALILGHPGSDGGWFDTWQDLAKPLQYCYHIYKSDVITSLQELSMIRTQIQITPEQARSLKRLAAREGKSVAELIRISVDNMLRGGGIKDQEALRLKAGAAAGKLKGPDNMAKNHDDYLAEALGQ